MTLLVDILNRAALECSVSPPSSWLGAQTDTTRQLLNYADDVRGDVTDRIDNPPPLCVLLTVTGTGAAVYSLPADFRRLQRDPYAVFERVLTRRPCIPVTTSGQWEALTASGAYGGQRFFRMIGYEGAWQIEFLPALETGSEVLVSYVSDNWLINGSTRKAALSDAADVSLLPRRLVERGIIMRFRQRSGMEYADVASEYEAQLHRFAVDSRTARKIDFGGARDGRRWVDNVPDVIPAGP
jgi:hypothetical protein